MPKDILVLALTDRVEKFIKENNFDIKIQFGAFLDHPYDLKAVWENDKNIDAIMSK